MRVNVVYAIPQRFWSVDLTVDTGTSVREVVELAKRQRDFAEINDVSTDEVAIWGVKVGQDHEVKEGDRIEILRSLVQHPMDRRRNLARRGC